MDGRGGAAARHLGPPRTLDVQQFAAARSSEVQALYNALKAQQEANSSGVGGQSSSSLTTPRHLRRRTASHNRRIPFRWMHNAAQTGKKKQKANANSSSHLKSNVAPASVQAESSSAKRKQPEVKRIPSRRVRRRIELQGVREGAATCMRDGTRRLATHVWHAKRFPMTKTWGYCLPQGLPGRGRGSKAVFKWVKEAAILHDASFFGLIELQGTEDAILRILGQALEPPPGRPISGSCVTEEEMHGLLYGNAVLHYVGEVPREAIAPVTILWRPSSSESRGSSEHSTGGEGRGEERQLWIWVHPSAFDNAFLALSTACEGQGMNDYQASVKCRSRKGELARLDILGTRAIQVLQKILRPVPRKEAEVSSNEITGLSGHLIENTKVATNTSPDVSQSLTARILAKADCLPAAAVIALDVYDPRDTPRSFYSVTNASLSKSAPTSAPAGVRDSNLSGETLSTGDQSVEEEIVVQEKKADLYIKEDTDVIHWESLLEKGLSKEVSDSPSLWSPPAERKMVAMSQKAFSERRRKKRKAYFTDGDSNSIHSNLDAGAPDSRVEESGICPILLLKHGHLRPSASGWSIIMPITWVHAFWVPLVFAGGRVIGLRERHWLSTDAGLPYYPHDFPDCPAHAQHLAVEMAAFNSANQARPPSKRSPSFTVSPLQWAVMNATRDHMPNGSGGTAAVASQLIDKEHGEQLMEERDRTLGDIPKATDLDGDTAMTDVGSTVASVPSPPLSHTVISEFRNFDSDTAMAGTGNTVTNSPVSQAGCQTVHGVGFPKLETTLADDSVNEKSSPDRVSSLLLAPHGADGGISLEFVKLEGDAAMPGSSTLVTSSPVSPAGCQTVAGAVIPGYANLEGHTTITATTAFFTSSPVSSTACQTVGVVIPEFGKMEWGTTMAGTGSMVTSSSLSPATCQTVSGVIVPEVTKPLGDNAVREAESLPGGVPSLAAAPVDAANVPDTTFLVGDTSMAETETETKVVQSSSGMTAEGSSLRQLTMPLGDDESIMCDFLPDGLNSSTVASELQQPVIDAHHTDLYDSGRCSFGEKAFTAEETIDALPTSLPSLEVLEKDNVIKCHVRGKSPTPLPRSPGEHPFPVLNSNLKFTTERSTLPLFVARTVDVLMQVFREKGLQHTLLLCHGSMKYRSALNGLRNGTLEWRASHKPVESVDCTTGTKVDAGVGGHMKGCYVRVLIVVPRKGVIKENGSLCSPTKDDFDGFLSRSQHWQGVETSWLDPQANELKQRKGKRKGKGKGKGKRKGEAAKALTRQSHSEAEDFTNSTAHLRGGYEECSNRETIGCITSTGPEGSLWSGTGICEVSSLMKLRAMQWQDQRWWNRKEILLLAGNKLSPILRPVLVSIVLETGPQKDVIW